MSLRSIFIFILIWSLIFGSYVSVAYGSNGGFSSGEIIVAVVLFAGMLAISYLLRKIFEARARRT